MVSLFFFYPRHGRRFRRPSRGRKRFSACASKTRSGWWSAFLPRKGRQASTNVAYFCQEKLRCYEIAGNLPTRGQTHGRYGRWGLITIRSVVINPDRVDNMDPLTTDKPYCWSTENNFSRSAQTLKQLFQTRGRGIDFTARVTGDYVVFTAHNAVYFLWRAANTAAVVTLVVAAVLSSINQADDCKLQKQRNHAVEETARQNRIRIFHELAAARKNGVAQVRNNS